MKSTQKTWNVHGQRKKFVFGTQRNLYSTDLRWGFALPNAKDTNMLLPFALGNAKVPNANGFASQLNIGLKSLFFQPKGSWTKVGKAFPMFQKSDVPTLCNALKT